MFLWKNLSLSLESLFFEADLEILMYLDGYENVHLDWLAGNTLDFDFELADLFLPSPLYAAYSADRLPYRLQLCTPQTLYPVGLELRIAPLLPQMLQVGETEWTDFPS